MSFKDKIKQLFKKLNIKYKIKSNPEETPSIIINKNDLYKIPDWILNYKGLNLKDSNITKLPDNININKYLNRTLDADLDWKKAKGKLDFTDSNIIKIPDDFKW